MKERKLLERRHARGRDAAEAGSDRQRRNRDPKRKAGRASGRPANTDAAETRDKAKTTADGDAL